MNKRIDPFLWLKLTFLFLFLPAIALAYFSLGSLTPDRVLTAAQAEIQFDSFMSAGWFVGFFYFWGVLTRKDVARGVGTLLAFEELIAPKPGDSPRVASPDGKTFVGKPIDPRDFPARTFNEGIIALLSFALSAVLALDSIFTASPVIVVLGLGMLVLGVWLLVRSWYLFQSMIVTALDAEQLVKTEIESIKRAKTTQSES